MSIFTRTEWEIIEHRLQVPDAIAEVLVDDNPDEYTTDSIIADVELLEFGGHTRTEFNEQELTILRECCEGSTFFAGMDDAVARDELSKGYRLAYHHAANRLEKRFNVVTPRA